MKWRGGDVDLCVSVGIAFVIHVYDLGNEIKYRPAFAKCFTL